MADRKADCFACDAVAPSIIEGMKVGWKPCCGPDKMDCGHTDDFCPSCVLSFHEEHEQPGDCYAACAIALSAIPADYKCPGCGSFVRGVHFEGYTGCTSGPEGGEGQ